MPEKINVKELKNLFAEIKNNNNIAFEKFYSKYDKLVLKITYSILKNKNDAEDVMQLVFEKIYSMNKEKLPTKNEASWLYSVTRNETLNYLKSNKNNINLYDLYEIEANNNELDKVIEREKYNKLISKLNDDEKEIVSLKIISNCSFEEIGKVLNMPTGTVKWRYYKAVNTLKLLLSNFTMFIISFISSIFAIKNEKKEATKIQEENIMKNNEFSTEEDKIQQYEQSEEILQNSQKPGENTITNTIETASENTVNYTAISLIGVSIIFLVLTIIFLIIFTKYQLKQRDKLSK